MELLFGHPDRVRAWRPLPPFDPRACAALEQASAALLADAEVRGLADVVTFAFWARRANLERLRRGYADGPRRLGRGMVFHIAPANVPVTFAFSWAFALLAGNASVVRVPSQPFPQVAAVARVLRALADAQPDSPLGDSVAFVRYGRDDQATADLSAQCAARVVWGSDPTIEAVRRIPLPVRSVEVIFSDRYSMGVLDAGAVLAAADDALARLAQGFYNDSLLMDQNACSTPHLLLWHGADPARNRAARARFWAAVNALAERRYELPAVHAVDRYTRLCEMLMDGEGIEGVEHRGQAVYRVELPVLPPDVTACRALFGLFFNHDIRSLEEIRPLASGTVQTLTYFGVDPQEIARQVTDGGAYGIDRIVPFGAALDLDVRWDGVDVIHALSRIVDVR